MDNRRNQGRNLMRHSDYMEFNRVKWIKSAITTVYVDELTLDVTEAMLYDKFSTAGPVLSIRVGRDKKTKKSLGCAFVSFKTAAAAKQAIDIMNYDLINGAPCRIMWSQYTTKLCLRFWVGNICVKNLDKSVNDKDLYEMFSPFGDIVFCKVANNDSGQPRGGLGFISFSTLESANLAIQKINRMSLNGKRVCVGKFVTQHSSRHQTIQYRTNMYVKNLGDEVDSNVLVRLFSKFGVIVSAVVMVDKQGKSKGFGFISFESHISAAEAVKKMQRYVLNGRPIYCGWAQKKLPNQRSKLLRKRENQSIKSNDYRSTRGSNLYIKNLEDEFDDERLKEEFSKFGRITSAKVMLDKDGQSRGFGFVCFSSPEEATKAIAKMNGHVVISKPLYVALAQSKDERAAYLAKQRKLKETREAVQLCQGHDVQTVYPQGYYTPNIQVCHPQRTVSQLSFNQPVMRQGTSTWRPLTGHIISSVAQQQQHNRPTVPISVISSSQQRQGTDNKMREMGNTTGVTKRLQQQISSKPQPQYKIKSSTTRNQPGSQAPQDRLLSSGLQSLTIELAKADPQRQKQIIREHLYRAIEPLNPSKARKITDMLLKMDNSEILHLLESKHLLRIKVNETLDVLKKHQQEEKRIQPDRKQRSKHHGKRKH